MSNTRRPGVCRQQTRSASSAPATAAEQHRPAHAIISEDGGKTWKPLAQRSTEQQRWPAPLPFPPTAEPLSGRRGAVPPAIPTTAETQWTACAGLSSMPASSPIPSIRRVLCLRRARRQAAGQHQWRGEFVPTPAAFPQAEDFASRFRSAAPARRAVRRPRAWKAICGWPSTPTAFTTPPTAARAFTKLDGVQEAYSLGFGKAAPGQEFSRAVSGRQNRATPGPLPFR